MTRRRADYVEEGTVMNTTRASVNDIMIFPKLCPKLNDIEVYLVRLLKRLCLDKCFSFHDPVYICLSNERKIPNVF